MSGQRFYSEDEAEEILRVAASKAAPVGRMDRDRLMQAAAELGITPEAVLEAEMQVAQQREEEAERAEFDAHQRKEFLTHLTSYLTVNPVLIAINFFTSGKLNWSLITAFFWGIALFFGFVSAYVKTSDSYQSDFRSWQKKRRRRAEKQAAMGGQDAVLDRLVLESSGPVNRLEAIREVRDATGASLAEAKSTVDAYAARHPDVFA